MKHNLKGQYMSSFHLKQQFIGLLSDALRNSEFNIILGFESSFRDRICTLKVVDSKKVDVRVNLDYINKSVKVEGCSLTFKVHYCAFFVAEFISQIERAKKDVPQSYFEGLVFLNAIEIYKAERIVSIYSPLSHWEQKPKCTFCLRPLEISSAINSLNKLRIIGQSELNEVDKDVIKKYSDNLLLYSGLPEIAYVYARVPVYTLVDSLKRIADIIAKAPETAQEYPLLTLAPFENINQMSVNSLFLSCVKSSNEFLMGAAIRILAFLQPPYYLDLDNNSYEKLVKAMKLYIDYSISSYHELSKIGGYFITDNLFAIKIAVKSINDYMSMCGTSISAGNIHCIM